MRGLYGQMPAYPATPGFEGVGIIEGVERRFQQDVPSIGPGRKVVVVESNHGQLAGAGRHACPLDFSLCPKCFRSRCCRLLCKPSNRADHGQARA